MSATSAVLVSRSGNSPILKSVRADGLVNGLLFELAVEQCYENASDVNVEAVYTFPLPWGAVLLGMEFVLGEKVLKGTVVAKADAEEAYEVAVEAGDTAIMLERAADGLYTVNVGNLMAREQAIVRFRYAQLLSFEQGQVRIAVPTVIAPRYGDPARAGLRHHQVPAHDLLAEYPLTLNIVLAGEVSTGRLSSPSHPLSVRQAGGQLEVGLAASARLDRDFVLLLNGLAGKSLAFIGKDGDGLVALASFCPAPDDQPLSAPLSVKILVDCSGSMNGDSIHSARKALHEVLKNLDRSDRFTYSRFGTDVVHYSQSLMAATQRAVRDGARWILETNADMGGTAMKQALLSTFALGQPFDADILLITDGEVWDVDSLIASAEKAGQRIFAVGIGAAPASSLLHALASKTGGACEFVGVNDDIEAAILRTFKRMRQAPVRNVGVEWDAAPRWQSTPDQVVFSGETVHAFAGFQGTSPAAATLSWRDAGDTVCGETLSLKATLVEGDTLARVAAAARLRAANKEEQHALALEYQLVTDSTNLLIVHQRADLDRAIVLPVLRVAPQMAAAGWAGMGMASGLPGQPALWRREQASLALQSPAGNYDVPAFLRMGSETPEPYLQRDKLTAFLQKHAAGATTLEELDDDLAPALIDELKLVVKSGFSEQDVIRAFMDALARLAKKHGIARRFWSSIRQLGRQDERQLDLERRAASIAADAFNLLQPRVHRRDIPAFLRKQAD